VKHLIGTLVLKFQLTTGRHKEIPLSPRDLELGDLGPFQGPGLGNVPASAVIGILGSHRGSSPPEGTLQLEAQFTQPLIRGEMKRSATINQQFQPE
jgi:hypothetical protein